MSQAYRDKRTAPGLYKARFYKGYIQIQVKDQNQAMLGIPGLVLKPICRCYQHKVLKHLRFY